MSIINRSMDTVTLTVTVPAYFTKVLNANLGASIDIDMAAVDQDSEGWAETVLYGIGRKLMDTNVDRNLSDDEQVEATVSRADDRYRQMKGLEPVRGRAASGGLGKFFKAAFESLVPVSKRKGSPKLKGSHENMSRMLLEWRPNLNVSAIEAHAKVEMARALEMRNDPTLDLGI